jgi:hypothetical protein
MTLRLRLEKPGMELTVCGNGPDPQWLEGLANGKIARAQGGLTSGQLMWLRIYEAGMPWANPDLFDPEDTGEL